MFRKLILAALIATMVGCILGCSKREATITGPQGERTTIETDRSGTTKMTIESEEGEAKIEISEEVDLSALGVDIYPGAQPEAGGTYELEELGGEAAKSAALTTPDSLEKVAEFYKGKYADGATVLQPPDGSVIINKDEESRIITIAVVRDEDDQNTHISITAMPKADE